MEELFDATLLLIESIIHTVNQNQSKVEKPVKPMDLKANDTRDLATRTSDKIKTKQPLFIKTRGRRDLLTDIDRGTGKVVSKGIKRILK